ncbi:MAG: hypothetical protein H0T99_01545 [Geodermatophilaceae bacterium]|nr:hypothetical protein [Geodermatophilaceae bacterium]
MHSDALVAALGVETVAAVHGYRLEVIAEARRRGLSLVSEAPSDLLSPFAGDFGLSDTADIRLIILEGPDGGGARLRWKPDTGWWLARPGANPDRNSYVPADALGFDLVPAASALLDWVARKLHGAHRPADRVGVGVHAQYAAAAPCGTTQRRNRGSR